MKKSIFNQNPKQSQNHQINYFFLDLDSNDKNFGLTVLPRKLVYVNPLFLPN